jgi:hypothetical protein
MLRILTFILTFFMLTGVPSLAQAPAPAPQQQAQTKEQTVCITRTGKKYHTGNPTRNSEAWRICSREGVQTPSLNKLRLRIYTSLTSACLF